jgi:hypothetical protein
MTLYLKTFYAQHSAKVTYDFRKSKTGKLPTQYKIIRGRNLTLVPLDIITISNDELLEDVSENISVNNELHCVGKLQPYNINHHNSYKTYIQNRNNGSTTTTTCNSTYNPNNKQYGIQGATTASNKIVKEKKNNITQNAITRKPENDKEIYVNNDNCKNQTIMNLGRVKRVTQTNCVDEKK